MSRRLLLAVSILLAWAAVSHADVILSESFDDVSALTAAGWWQVNHGNPIGPTSPGLTAEVMPVVDSPGGIGLACP